MTVEIKSGNTWVNITPYIAWQGLTFSRNDVDDPDTGRDMSGLMHRGRVAIKEKMNVQTIPLTQTQLNTLYQLVLPQSFQVRVNPYPATNASHTMTMYSNNFSTSYIIKKPGSILYTAKFPLIEI